MKADGESRSGERKHFAQHHPDDTPPFGAQRNSDTDFVCSSRHRISHGAVKPNTRNHQRKKRECRAEIGEGALLDDGVVNALRLRHHARDRDIRRGVVDGLANSFGQRKRVARGTQFEDHGVRRTFETFCR